MGRNWYEVIISIDRSRGIRVSIPFRWSYNPYKPKRIISLDIDLKGIVVYNGKSIMRIDTRFIVHRSTIFEDSCREATEEVS